jgi:hypothetical protein
MEPVKAVITFLQIASILAAAAFASLALFTEYKKDGKITRYGRFAVLGIVLSAILSLGTQWGQAELDRRKAKKADDQRATELSNELDRYGRQMIRLRSLSRQQRETLIRNQRLGTDMQVALREQRRLQGEVRNSRAQEANNATRLFARMWSDANRVGFGSITAVVEIDCFAVRSDSLEPIIAPSWPALLTIQSTNAAAARPAQEVTLTSLEGRFTSFISNHETSGHNFRQYYIYNSFNGSLGDFADIAPWRHASVSLLIVGESPGFARRYADLAHRTLDPPVNLSEIRMSVPADRDVTGIRIPCVPTFGLLVNGRDVILEWRGNLFELISGLHPGSVVLDFANAPIIASSLPRLGVVGSGPADRR